jgi:hypothetical protein
MAFVSAGVMPVMDIRTAVARRRAIVDFTREILVSGTDYGLIPGAGSKPTLLKPGAEKLSTFFGLSPQFELVEKELDWTGERHGGEPFFYYQYRCSLFQDDSLAGQGLGSCNSWEKKYRYRNASRHCPRCGRDTIIKGRDEYGGGWLCFVKKGGCGAKFADGDLVIEGQPTGQVPNENPADLVNTVDKMAQKRALFAAPLIAVNASEFFTQDIEDMDFGPVTIVEGEVLPAAAEAPAAPATNGHAHPAAESRPQPAAPAEGPAAGGNPEWDGQVDPKWRERLSSNARPSVATVCSVVALACGFYRNEAQVRDWLPEGQQPSDRLSQADALTLYDLLIERARAAAGVAPRADAPAEEAAPAVAPAEKPARPAASKAKPQRRPAQSEARPQRARPSAS